MTFDSLRAIFARRLLASKIPARVAYCVSDGTPRVVATWFQWTGDELVMPLAARRFLGESQASAYLDGIDQQGTKMARIAVRPPWVGVVDFQSRMPSALGGIQL